MEDDLLVERPEVEQAEQGGACEHHDRVAGGDGTHAAGPEDPPEPFDWKGWLEFMVSHAQFHAALPPLQPWNSMTAM